MKFFGLISTAIVLIASIGQSCTATFPDESSTIPLQEIIENLNEAGLLSEEAYQKALVDVEQGRLELKSELLSRLADNTYQQSLNEHNLSNDFSAQNTPLGATESYRLVTSAFAIGSDLNEDELKEFSNVNLRETSSWLDQLNKTGILSTRVYSQLKTDILTEFEQTHVFLPISLAERQSQLYRQASGWMELEEDLSIEILAARLTQLKEAGILSNQKHKDLLEALQQQQLNGSIELLNYLDNSRLLDLCEYSENTEDYFTKVHSAVADMLVSQGIINSTFGEFEVTFKYSEDVLKNSNISEIEYFSFNEAKVSVHVDNRIYRQSNAYRPSKEEGDSIYRTLPRDTIKIFNKILHDQNSPYRVYEVSIPSFHAQKTFRDPDKGNTQIGFIALTKAQADIYFEMYVDNIHPTPLFTSARIDEILSLFEQIGLLDHLSPDQIESSQQLILESYIMERHELFSAFEDVILLFDWDGVGHTDIPYQSLTKYFSAISRGQFLPTEISDEFDQKSQTAAQTFILNGTEYHIPLSFEVSLDPKFFSSIRSVAEQEISTGKFYAVNVDYVPGYMFLSLAQLEALIAENLIELASSE
ncbi:hypothetical protein [Adonisia turfae]|uniref:Uncharacterized protein n=1 Tax=Adonisia turfae CCMR0081 TaxID=2292702 RepID=A0A6M0RRC3_9CYAN|nr:hypothetical protein [Adonisia turfae]NEZ58261.1 hypothetical protein [Adonisia turfae CCMR0081]